MPPWASAAVAPGEPDASGQVDAFVVPAPGPFLGPSHAAAVGGSAADVVAAVARAIRGLGRWSATQSWVAGPLVGVLDRTGRAGGRCAFGTMEEGAGEGEGDGAGTGI